MRCGGATTMRRRRRCRRATATLKQSEADPAVQRQVRSAPPHSLGITAVSGTVDAVNNAWTGSRQ